MIRRMVSSRTAVAVLVAACAAIFGPELTAWGDHGHEIVARIAARKMLPNTKRKMVTILRKGGDDQLHLPALLGPVGSPQPSAANFATAMAKMATWPDHMPGGKGATAP